MSRTPNYWNSSHFGRGSRGVWGSESQVLIKRIGKNTVTAQESNTMGYLGSFAKTNREVFVLSRAFSKSLCGAKSGPRLFLEGI